MKFVYKALLPLFIGMALVSCAGADSSTQRKVEERPDLSKAGTPVADTLAAKMPKFIRSAFKGTIDSVPGEYYYHAADGRVDTLFQKDDGQYKPIVSIVYDSLSGQNSYELKKGDCSYTVKDDALEEEACFPKYVKKYWDNGNPKQIMTGILYRNDQGDFALDSGHNEIYFENGKIYQQSDWKDKQPVAGKLWYENGILYVEMDIPTGNLKSYYENGTIQFEVTGSNAFNKILEFHEIKGLEGSISENVFAIETGHMNGYYDNGKPMGQLQYKEKKPISIKLWHEDGSLYKEGDASRGFYKTYRPNGKLSREVSGKFHFSDNLDVILENASDKRWNKNGILMTEIVFPKYAKWYSDNGILSTELEGALYYDNQGKIQVQNGSRKDYYDNGKISSHQIYREKALIGGKTWSENGAIKAEGDVSREFYKIYLPNGKLSREVSGKFHFSDSLDVILESASDKCWNEKEILITEIVFPKYAKFYSDSGTLELELEGTLYYDDQGNIQVQDGSVKHYYDNGKISSHQIYKEKALIGGKTWSENGAITAEGDVSRGFDKAYFPNGKLSLEVSGKFHYDGRKRILEKASEKWWNEKGILIIEIDFPKYAKSYFDSGTLEFEAEGTLYYDSQNKIQVQDGFKKGYYDNGKMALHQIYKEKKLVSKTAWNESGIVTISAELPNRYREFYDDGKIKAQATGTIVEEDDSFKIKDGTYNEYDQNGKVTYSATFKDFQKILER